MLMFVCVCLCVHLCVYECVCAYLCECVYRRVCVCDIRASMIEQLQFAVGFNMSHSEECQTAAMDEHNKYNMTEIT